MAAGSEMKVVLQEARVREGWVGEEGVAGRAVRSVELCRPGVGVLVWLVTEAAEVSWNVRKPCRTSAEGKAAWAERDHETACWPSR